jgi:uncharacterized protein (DUF2235 family)
MLNKCGLLQKGSNNLIPYATRMYRYGKPAVAKKFKKTFSRECKPHFVGVWDTVKSVGLLIRRKFPNAKLNPDVMVGRHALSIDEKRSKFRPNLWDEPAKPDNPNQSIVQVWFAGVHCDIGGSYKEDGLSNIALHWLVDEARAEGLIIKPNELKKMKPDHKDKMHNPLLPFWWILGWCRRKILPGSHIHPSVSDRVKDVKSYNPKNLP